jgi:hypothetical protein
MSQLLSVNVGLPRDIELLTFGGWPLLAQSGRSWTCPLPAAERTCHAAELGSQFDPEWKSRISLAANVIAGCTNSICFIRSSAKPTKRTCKKSFAVRMGPLAVSHNDALTIPVQYFVARPARRCAVDKR